MIIDYVQATASAADPPWARMVFPRETVTVPGQNGDSACDGQPFQAREAIPRETVEVFMCVWGRVWLHWRWHVRLGTLLYTIIILGILSLGPFGGRLGFDPRVYLGPI